jgi:hypothetical protein
VIIFIMALTYIYALVLSTYSIYIFVKLGIECFLEREYKLTSIVLLVIISLTSMIYVWTYLYQRMLPYFI